jgi:hypothetical protein
MQMFSVGGFCGEVSQDSHSLILEISKKQVIFAK